MISTARHCSRPAQQLRNLLLDVTAGQLEFTPPELTLLAGRLYQNDKLLTLGWKELIASAYEQRCSLTAQAHYATPEPNFDRTSEQGCLFAYHVYGTTIIEVTMDCLLGAYKVGPCRVFFKYRVDSTGKTGLSKKELRLKVTSICL